MIPGCVSRCAGRLHCGWPGICGQDGRCIAEETAGSPLAAIFARPADDLRGRSQAVRQRTLTPSCGGSNPPALAFFDGHYPPELALLDIPGARSAVGPRPRPRALRAALVCERIGYALAAAGALCAVLALAGMVWL